MTESKDKPEKVEFESNRPTDPDKLIKNYREYLDYLNIMDKKKKTKVKESPTKRLPSDADSVEDSQDSQDAFSNSNQYGDTSEDMNAFPDIKGE